MSLLPAGFATPATPVFQPNNPDVVVRFAADEQIPSLYEAAPGIPYVALERKIIPAFTSPPGGEPAVRTYEVGVALKISFQNWGPTSTSWIYASMGPSSAGADNTIQPLPALLLGTAVFNAQNASPSPSGPLISTPVLLFSVTAPTPANAYSLYISYLPAQGDTTDYFMDGTATGSYVRYRQLN